MKRSQSLVLTAFWLALAFTFVMATIPKPPPIPGQPSDKIQHIIAFIVLMTLAAQAYRRTGLIRLGIMLSGFGAVIELVQMIPALQRDAQLLDWVADTFAAATVAVVVAATRRFRDR